MAQNVRLFKNTNMHENSLISNIFTRAYGAVEAQNVDVR